MIGAGFNAVHAILAIPLLAAAGLAASPNYRASARINVLATFLTLCMAASLLFRRPAVGLYLQVDDLSVVFIVLNTFVGFTASLFSASYIAHEIEIGRLTPARLRFYHAMYQVLMFGMNLALVSNNLGLMWVAIELATLTTVAMVGVYRTHEAIEAAWKYFILGSVGIALALFGTILVYVAARPVVGEGLQGMVWTVLMGKAAAFDPALLNLAFVFLLLGYGTKVGLAPLHAWLPDAHAEGPTPISAVLSGLLLNVALYAVLRFKMLLAANPAALAPGPLMVTMGLVSLVFAAFMLYRRRDIKRLFAYSSIEHMGVIVFAFGMGGPLANFAGLLHMTMHSLTKSAIFFSVGHIAQVKGSQKIADITRPDRHPPGAWLDAGGRRDRDRRPAAVRHLHERVPGRQFDLRASALARHPAGAGHRRRLRRAAAEAAGAGVRRALARHGAGACFLPPDVRSLRSGAGRRSLLSAPDHHLVPARRGAAGMTAVNTDDWLTAIDALAEERLSLVSLWGEPGRVHMAVSSDEAPAPKILSLDCPDRRYPSVGARHAPAIRLERALADLHGLTPDDALDRRPWLDHGRWGEPHAASAPTPYPFLPAEGESLHQIAVGPVHAGIIEPGHFRFTANGETIVRLEARLGYLHRGLGARMIGRTPVEAARFAARACGDSTVGYSLAFARAVEAALGIEAPPRAVWLRALMAELERLANHLGDIGAICNDASFSLMQAHCAVLREHVLRASAAAFGHRLMMDAVTPGGVAADLDPTAHRLLRDLVAVVRARFPRLVDLYDDTASLQDRTVGAGVLTPELARRFAAGGYVGRASGRTFDARRASAYAPYDALAFDVPTREAGDVNARVWVRIDEVTQSLSLIDQILTRAAGWTAARRASAWIRRRRGAGRRIPRRHPGLGALGRRPHRPLSPARPLLVPVAAAGGRDRGQHRRRLPALQQILQLRLCGGRSLMSMPKLFAEALFSPALTEAAPGPDDAALAQLAARLDTAAHRRLGRSLSIRQVDAGSCNGCELEIHALSNAFYDLERFGLRFVASPRHADVLLVTGPVTRNMREALERTHVATPGPKWVVACGDCAAGTGLFNGGYACLNGVAEVVPVDLAIRGCPPTPTALLAGLLALFEDAIAE